MSILFLENCPLAMWHNDTQCSLVGSGLAHKTNTYGHTDRHPHPGSGPPLARSNTWCGFRCRRKACRSVTPWLPPLFPLTNTSTGSWSLVKMSGEGKHNQRHVLNLKFLSQIQCVAMTINDTCIHYYVHERVGRKTED